MHNVFVVMPVRGRLEQSVDAMRRLIATAQYPATYLAVGGYSDAEVVNSVGAVPGAVPILVDRPIATYWEALQRATAGLQNDHLVVNVANDVLPCRGWLEVAIADYEKRQAQFTKPHDPVIGFNGDGHQDDHACHFLISMRRVREYGGWPIWYHHNFGDTEFITRSAESGDFYKSRYAILFHNHPYVSDAQSDSVYGEGLAKFKQDRALFKAREKNGWIQPPQFH